MTQCDRHPAARAAWVVWIQYAMPLYFCGHCFRKHVEYVQYKEYPYNAIPQV